MAVAAAVAHLPQLTRDGCLLDVWLIVRRGTSGCFLCNILWERLTHNHFSKCITNE